MPPRGTSLGIDNQASAQTNKVLAAARTGESLFVTRLIISNGATAGTVQVVADPAGAATGLSQLFYLGINQVIAIDYSQSALKAPLGKAVGYTSTTVTTHSIQATGYSLPTAA